MCALSWLWVGGGGMAMENNIKLYICLTIVSSIFLIIFKLLLFFIVQKQPHTASKQVSLRNLEIGTKGVKAG